MTNLDSILKSRDITLPTKLCLVKAMVFPVVMHGCESCTIKKARSEERRVGKECQTLFSWAPKSLQIITAAMKLKDACSLEKSYDQPHLCIRKQRYYFTSKVHIGKAMVFPVVMHGCESFTIKKAERQRIDTFELWCWRRL